MTYGTEEPGQILSRDARGRVLVSRERRESLLAEYDRSGMSGVKFAQYVGIKYSTLARGFNADVVIETVKSCHTKCRHDYRSEQTRISME